MSNSKTKTPPVYIHIGYHKTGTTYLQQNCFNKHNEILFLGFPWIDPKLRELMFKIKFSHDFEFNAQEIRSDFLNLVEEKLNERKSPPKAILVSLESLHSGAEWFGALTTIMACRLNEVFNPCKIILGIRNQSDYIVSNYKEYLRHGGKHEFNDFLDNSYYFQHCLKQKLKYDLVIDLYSELFSEENICVYLQELLKTDPKFELKKISKFMKLSDFNIIKTKTYATFPDELITIIRLLNILLAKDFIQQYYEIHTNKSFFNQIRIQLISRIENLSKKILPFSSHDKLKTKKLDDLVTQTYAKHNKRLSLQLKIDLTKYNYVTQK